MNMSERRDFVVVCQGAAACRFQREEPLTLSYRFPNDDLAHLLFGTRWVDEGLEDLVPRDLYAAVVVRADDLHAAAVEGARHANMTAAVIGLTTNAVVGALEPFVVYERVPVEGRREFLQSQVAPERGIPRNARRARPDLVLKVLAGLTTNPESERLLRAASQYNDALQHWRPGYETRAVSPLWTAAEALTDVALRAELSTSGDEAALASSWGISVERQRRDWRSELTAQVRRRLIFQGDDETYAKAKKASDGWEHGFLSFETVRELAAQCRDKTAAYVRAAFLRLAQVDEAAVGVLLNRPFNSPKQFFPITRYFRGWIVGDADDASGPDDVFPYLDWSSRLSAFSVNEDGRSFDASFEDKATPRFSDDVQFQGGSIEIWGPSPDSNDD